MKIKISSPLKMRKIGSYLAQDLAKREMAVVLSLEGDLGSGKTTFLQGFAKGLNVEEEITSPTFLIFKKYKTEGQKFFYHFDAYRVEEKDLLSLGINEIMEKKENLIAIEWGNKVKKNLPKEAIRLFFEVISDLERELIVSDKSGIISDKFFERARSSVG